MTDEKPLPPSKATEPKYQLLMELGRGGMGVVHLAISRGPQGFTKLCVLKMMRKSLVGDSESHQMFLEEARISARLTHPNIVHVYEVIDYQGCPTLVMEYLEGQTLWSIVRGPTIDMPLPLLLAVLARVLAGLHAAHELRDYDGTPLDLIHRDVSPHNVFVLYDGQVKVLDFGICKASGSEVETRSGVLKGKIRYMPPEQLIRENQDRRVDVFAVGVMLWEALARRRFWGEMAEADVVTDLLARKLPPLPAEAGAPPALAAMCARALAPNPGDRYATAGEFQRAIEDYLAGQPERSGADEVGAFLRARFGGERVAAKRVIEDHVRAAERLSQERAATAVPEGDREGDTRVVTAHTPSRSRTVTAATVATTAISSRAARSRRPGLVAALAGVAAVALAVAAVAVGRSGRPSAAPVASAAADPAVPALACGAGLKSCDGQCVSLERPDHGCGGEACHACNVSNATARCNQAHGCDIAVCYQDFDDCDGDSSNGCETNVRTDADHCGGCGRKCPALPHAQRGCGDACTIWRCDAGFRDCNALVADGCEVAVSSDPAHCGRCGHACKGAQKCRRGECS